MIVKQQLLFALHLLVLKIYVHMLEDILVLKPIAKFL